MPSTSLLVLNQSPSTSSQASSTIALESQSSATIALVSGNEIVAATRRNRSKVPLRGKKKLVDDALGRYAKFRWPNLQKGQNFGIDEKCFFYVMAPTFYYLT